MNSIDPATTVSSAPTLAPAFDVRLEWRSAVATHVDRLRVNANALQADGRWLAVGAQATYEDGEVKLDAGPWLRPAAQATVELGRDSLHLPEDLRGPFVDEVLAGLPEPFEADYVRLNLDAVA